MGIIQIDAGETSPLSEDGFTFSNSQPQKKRACQLWGQVQHKPEEHGPNYNIASLQRRLSR